MSLQGVLSASFDAERALFFSALEESGGGPSGHPPLPAPSHGATPPSLPQPRLSPPPPPSPPPSSCMLLPNHLPPPPPSVFGDGGEPGASCAARTRQKAGWAKRRKNKRYEGQQAHGPKKIRSSTSAKYSKPFAIKVAYAVKNLPVASGAFMGIRLSTGRIKPWTMAELLQKGFEVEEWDGVYVFLFSRHFLSFMLPPENLAYYWMMTTVSSPPLLAVRMAVISMPALRGLRLLCRQLLLEALALGRKIKQ
jgi:hypothetical protein